MGKCLAVTRWTGCAKRTCNNGHNTAPAPRLCADCQKRAEERRARVRVRNLQKLQKKLAKSQKQQKNLARALQKAQEENEGLQQTLDLLRKCPLCHESCFFQDKKNAVAFYPCGHLCCEGCAAKLEKNCFACRAEIVLKTKLFFPL